MSLTNNCRSNINHCFRNVLSINVSDKICQYFYQTFVCLFVKCRSVFMGTSIRQQVTKSCCENKSAMCILQWIIYILLLFENSGLYILLLNKMYENLMYIYRYIFSRVSVVKKITCFSSSMVFHRELQYPALK